MSLSEAKLFILVCAVMLSACNKKSTSPSPAPQAQKTQPPPPPIAHNPLKSSVTLSRDGQPIVTAVAVSSECGLWHYFTRRLWGQNPRIWIGRAYMKDFGWVKPVGLTVQVGMTAFDEAELKREIWQRLEAEGSSCKGKVKSPDDLFIQGKEATGRSYKSSGTFEIKPDVQASFGSEFANGPVAIFDFNSPTSFWFALDASNPEMDSILKSLSVDSKSAPIKFGTTRLTVGEETYEVPLWVSDIDYSEYEERLSEDHFILCARENYAGQKARYAEALKGQTFLPVAEKCFQSR